MTSTKHVTEKPFFRIACATVIVFAGITVPSLDAQAAKAGTKAPAERPAASTPAAPKPAAKPLYSAARSQARQATLARGRAIATAREMADTILPRYKVDAS